MESEGVRSVVYGKEIRATVVLSFGFLFVFASYLALQNLQGSLNDEGGLGVLSLSCLYAAAILTAVCSPAVITLIGMKKTVMVAFIGHIIYVLSNFYPSYYTLIPSSVLVGAVTAPLWTCQGIYLTTCSLSISERTGMKPYVSLSRIYGIFYTMFEVGNICGNLLSSLVLYQGDYNVTVTNSSSFCGSNDCPGDGTVDIIADPDPVIVYILLGAFLACVATGLAIVTFCLPSLDNSTPTSKYAIKKSLLSALRFLIKSDFKYITPFVMFVCIQEVFTWTEITKSFVSCPIGIQNVGYTMTCYGLSIALFTILFSRITKFIPRYFLIGFARALDLALMLWTYHWIPTSKDAVLIYVLFALWAVGEAIWRTQSNV